MGGVAWYSQITLFLTQAGSSECFSHLFFFKKNGPTSVSFSFIFVLFKHTSLLFLQQIYVKQFPSSIRCRDLNPRPSKRGSPPITTRPGLPCQEGTKNHQSILLQQLRHMGLVKPQRVYGEENKTLIQKGIFRSQCHRQILEWHNNAMLIGQKKPHGLEYPIREHHFIAAYLCYSNICLPIALAIG